MKYGDMKTGKESTAPDFYLILSSQSLHFSVATVNVLSLTFVPHDLVINHSAAHKVNRRSASTRGKKSGSLCQRFWRGVSVHIESQLQGNSTGGLRVSDE